MGMRIDDEIYVHGYLDEIRQDKVIIRNEGGYFGTIVNELVEAKPIIHAKWIRHYYESYECSNCHNLINMLEHKTNYCKDCGAKMDKENENGDDD